MNRFRFSNCYKLRARSRVRVDMYVCCICEQPSTSLVARPSPADADVNILWKLERRAFELCATLERFGRVAKYYDVRACVCACIVLRAPIAYEKLPLLPQITSVKIIHKRVRVEFQLERFSFLHTYIGVVLCIARIQRREQRDIVFKSYT